MGKATPRGRGGVGVVALLTDATDADLDVKTYGEKLVVRGMGQYFCRWRVSFLAV